MVTLARYVGLSMNYSCSYLTFSNSQQVLQCQNVLTADCTVHLSLFHSDIPDLFWRPVWMAQLAVNL